MKTPVLLIFAMMSTAILAGDLMKNGSFSEWTDSPKAWSVAGKLQKVTQERETGLEEHATALKVEIVKEQPSLLGEIRQNVKASPNRKLKLTAWMKCSKGNTALIMIKLRKGRSEIKRLNTPRAGKEWKKIEFEFETGDADNVQVLCRYKQKAGNVGAVCYWTGITLK